MTATVALHHFLCILHECASYYHSVCKQVSLHFIVLYIVSYHIEFHNFKENVFYCEFYDILMYRISEHFCDALISSLYEIRDIAKYTRKTKNHEWRLSKLIQNHFKALVEWTQFWNMSLGLIF